jgi:hypothetical protein
VDFSNIHFGNRTLQKIRADLKRHTDPNELAHLDPDLRHGARVHRPEDWRPAFGQSAAATGVLNNQKFGAGDLFVFFGWFRRTAFADSAKTKLKFHPDDRYGRHMAFGWLQVGEVVDKLPLREDLLFLSDHPHVRFFNQEGKNNRIYVSAKNGLKAGVFSTESESIAFTREGAPRTQWLLDQAFESLIPKNGIRELTFHPNESQWAREGEKVTLTIVDIGQEFVFDGDRHKAASDYFTKRIEAALATKVSQCHHNF